MSAFDLSVIVPCYNAAATIREQLEALAGQQSARRWELVVADNGSTDASRTLAAQYQSRIPNMRIINATDRKGAAHARNVGARAAEGEALVFCDADDVVAPGWLEAMGDGLRMHDLVGCRLDVQRLNPPWLARTFPVQQSARLPTLRFLPNLRIAGGNSLGARRSVHEAIGGFDESWQFLEEADYCVRAQLAGFSLQFVPDAMVYYRYRQSLHAIYRQARNWAPYGARLYKRYVPQGGANTWLLWKCYTEEWIRLLKKLPQVRSREGRAKISRDLGFQVGRMIGSFQEGIPPVVYFP
jgi:GT2 family glycosyltransferase